MNFISENDKQKISEAIREAECRTSGELVTVIARASDRYYFIPTLWAALTALFMPAIGLLFDAIATSELLLIIQMSTFIVMLLVFHYQPIKMKLVPKAVKHSRAARLAREQFFEQGVHNTRDRTGILIFVSLAEHYIEILADQGINDKVEQSHWQEAVDEFIVDVKTGDITGGFLKAIKNCGDVLAGNFPVKEGDKNELPNHLIEL